MLDSSIDWVHGSTFDFPTGIHGNRPELDELFGSGGPAPNTRMSECQPVNLVHFASLAARTCPSKNVVDNETGETLRLMPRALKPYFSSAERNLGGKAL